MIGKRSKKGFTTVGYILTSTVWKQARLTSRTWNPCSCFLDLKRSGDNISFKVKKIIKEAATKNSKSDKEEYE